MRYNFKKHKTKNKSSKAYISVVKSGIGVSSAFGRKHGELLDKQAELFYDPDNELVAIKPTEGSKNSFKLHYQANGDGCLINCENFLIENGYDPEEIKQRYSPIIAEIDIEDKGEKERVIIINLKEHE